MAENVIYYGPPGTGKTYFMQKLIEKYTDYEIADKDICSSYTVKSEDWLLMALVIMQNNNPMSAPDIMTKISTLSLKYTGTASDVLEDHSIKDSTMGLSRNQPRIFFETCGKWFVDRLKLLEYDPDFMIKYMKSAKIEKRYDFITFHQSFVYEDFIEGIRPSVDPITKALTYDPQDGVFKKICKKAKLNPSKQFALFIDEINRGNISEIFGELISLIELDKRAGQYCELEAVLPYSKTTFKVPNNLDIIGTMNSADKSIATIDMALRRRFDFVNFPCDYEALENALHVRGIVATNVDGIDVIKLLKTINKRIELLLDANHVIGHAFFMRVNNEIEIKNVIQKKIVPLLEEYFFDDLQKVQMVLNDIDDTGALVANHIYTHQELDPDKLLNYTGDYTIETKKIYSIDNSFGKDAIKKIYDGVTV
ncbi:AAA family ATPase [Clostridium sp. VAP23]|uniref:AAA family ATPase n=1 Tax=Clostridium sp. VAP23 TaxID=2949981 RepID=UPI00207AA2F9|nr:AAA family ATPase [Clostridium sp. VAP23]